MPSSRSSTGWPSSATGELRVCELTQMRVCAGLHLHCSASCNNIALVCCAETCFRTVLTGSGQQHMSMLHFRPCRRCCAWMLV